MLSGANSQVESEGGLQEMSVSGRQKGSGWSLRAWQPNCSSSRPGTKWDLSLAFHSLAYAETFSMPEILSSRLSAQQGPPHPSGFGSNVSSQERPTLTSFCPNCVYCFKKKKKSRAENEKQTRTTCRPPRVRAIPHQRLLDWAQPNTGPTLLLSAL